MVRDNVRHQDFVDQPRATLPGVKSGQQPKLKAENSFVSQDGLPGPAAVSKSSNSGNSNTKIMVTSTAEDLNASAAAVRLDLQVFEVRKAWAR